MNSDKNKKLTAPRTAIYLRWFFALLVVVGLYFSLIHNPLPSDEEMIANFKTHRADFVEAVRRYRDYPRPPDKDTSRWYLDGDTLEVYKRAGIDGIDHSALTPWLPNAYSVETALRLHQEASTAKDFAIFYKYGSLRIRPATTPRIDHPNQMDETLAGGNAIAPGATVWKSTDGQHTYVATGDLATGGTLLIDGVLTIENYRLGQLGLTLEGADVSAGPSTTHTGAITTATEGNDRLTGSADYNHGRGNGGSDILDGDDTLLETTWQSDVLTFGNDDLYADGWIDLAALASYADFGGTGSSTGPGDWLAGNWGNDRLIASDSDDVLSGGAGQDLLLGGAGNDHLLGDRGWVATQHLTPAWSVTAVVENPFDTIYNDTNGAYEPDPWLHGAADTLFGGAGEDLLAAGTGNDLAYGELGNDTLVGGSGSDTLSGGTGDDRMTGDEAYNGDAYPNSERGNDVLDGGDGHDWLQGDLGDDRLDGGAGNDTLFGDNDGIAHAEGQEAVDWAGNGSRDGNDWLDAGAGDDLLNGGGGDDTLLGGDNPTGLEYGAVHQIRQRQPQSAGNRVHLEQSDIAVTTLYPSHVAAIKAGKQRQLLLRNPLFGAGLANCLAECNQQRVSVMMLGKRRHAQTIASGRIDSHGICPLSSPRFTTSYAEHEIAFNEVNCTPLVAKDGNEIAGNDTWRIAA